MSESSIPSEKDKTAGYVGKLLAAPKRDFLASIVVFLVALPLCMGIAIASGVPVAAGLITGIVGGLIVGWFAGAPLQVSGPAAGLTVIVYDVVQRHGLEVLGIVVLVAGVLQLLAGVLRYGRWFRAVSPAVIHGMLAGIGVLIFASQFHVMVDDRPKGSGIANLVSIPEAIQKGLPMPVIGSTQERAARLDLLQGFGALHEQQVQLRELAAERIPIPRPKVANKAAEDDADELPDRSQLDPLAVLQQGLSKRLTELVDKLNKRDVSQAARDPASLQESTQRALRQMEIALSDMRDGDSEQVRTSQAELQRVLEEVLANLKNHDWAAKIGMLTVISLLLWKAFVPTRLKLVPAPLVAVVVATVVTAILKLPVLYVEVPDNLWSEIHIPSLTTLTSVNWVVVFQAGLVLAIVASAETLLCATAVDQMQTETRTQYDQELAAQGVGNIICGMLGALPMTGVIVRSAANVEAGGKTRLSTIMHGVWLLVFVSLLASILRMIPTAALAAMLVYTGYKLINVKAIKNLRKFGKGEVVVYFATLGTIVCTDLLTGVLTGIFLSAVKLLIAFSHLETKLTIDAAAKTAVLELEGAATFIRLPVLAHDLEQVPKGVEFRVEFGRLNHIDHACLDLLMNWAKQHESTGGTSVVDWNALKRTSATGQQVATESAK